MPQITVQVNNQPYVVVCDDGEESHLQELAEFLDKEVTNLKENFGQVGDGRLLMMAGLMVADKLSEALAKIEAMQAEVEKLRSERKAEAEQTHEQEETVAAKLEEAAKHIEALSEQLTAAG